MPVSTSTTDYYLVRYQAQPPLVRGVVRRPLSPTEFTEACEMLLALAQQHRCPFWLLDGRADDESSRPPDVYSWLTEDFLPRVHKALGFIPSLAFVARAEFWAALQARHYAPTAPTPLFSTFRARWFTTEAEALAWLHQFRPTIGGAAQAGPPMVGAS